MPSPLGATVGLVWLPCVKGRVDLAAHALGNTCATVPRSSVAFFMLPHREDWRWSVNHQA